MTETADMHFQKSEGRFQLRVTHQKELTTYIRKRISNYRNTWCKMVERMDKNHIYKTVLKYGLSGKGLVKDVQRH